MITRSELMAAASGLERGSGAVVLIAMRTLLWRFFFITLGASIFSAGSRAACVPTGDVGIERCTALSLSPSPFVGVALFATTIWVLGAIVRRALTPAQAVDFINTTSLWALPIVAVGIILGQVSFWMIPLDGWPQPGTWISPFPFMSLNVDTSFS